MILGGNRRAVIENIRNCAENGRFHDKVELDDPVLSDRQIKNITDAYLENRKHLTFKLKTVIALAMTQLATHYINRNTEIVGIEKIPNTLNGVLITSNHFSPFENTVIRHLVNALGRRDLSIISQPQNFAMTGAIGFLMNYANTIPVSTEPRYLARDFLSVLKEKLVLRGEAVLLYPEQEMWFNYRKPRPPKNGAYFFSAKLNVPILSCFVEIVDIDRDDTPEFRQVKYVLHVLDVLFPDPKKSVRENTEFLSEQDYMLKKACYVNAYGKKLTYTFENGDIAGWKESL